MNRRQLLQAGFGIMATGLLAGCGVGRGSAIEIKPGDPLRVGVIPTATFAPLFIAIERGYTKDAGLELELQTVQNAAAIAPSVLNGQLQIGTAAASPFIAAVSKGLPLKAIANAARNSAPDVDETGLMVPDDSPIQRPRDLEGRTCAVNGHQPCPTWPLLRLFARTVATPARSPSWPCPSLTWSARFAWGGLTRRPWLSRSSRLPRVGGTVG